MARAYCSLDDVKRILRTTSSRESRVRFSSSYRDLKRDLNNSGNITLSKVAFVSSYSGHETFTFAFTDSTSFEVSGDVVGFLKNGNIQEALRIGEYFSVLAANWSGFAVAGDKIYITSNSDISDDDGEQFIIDASKIIDSELERRYGDLSKIPFILDISLEIPGTISYACSRFAAYEIFISLFSGLIERNSSASRWKNDAEENLRAYLKSKGAGPMWRSRASLITEVGVSGIKDGVIEIDNLADSFKKDYPR